MADPRDLPDPGPKAGAVEWEQAAANADGPPAAETGLLEQDEIDSLLGVSQGPPAGAPASKRWSTTTSSATSGCRCSRWCSIVWSGS